jgi:hypothetical protein
VELCDSWIWIELHGVNSNDSGWLFNSQADLIAFERAYYFILVKRMELIKLVSHLVDLNQTVHFPELARYKTYQRKGRCDKLTMIEADKIEKICLFKIEKPRKLEKPKKKGEHFWDFC